MAPDPYLLTPCVHDLSRCGGIAVLLTIRGWAARTESAGPVGPGDEPAGSEGAGETHHRHGRAGADGGGLSEGLQLRRLRHACASRRRRPAGRSTGPPPTRSNWSGRTSCRLEINDGVIATDGRQWNAWIRNLPGQVVVRDAPARLTMDVLFADNVLATGAEPGARRPVAAVPVLAATGVVAWPTIRCRACWRGRKSPGWSSRARSATLNAIACRSSRPTA